MSDIFREVEEDVRRERLEKLWKQYGDYIIAGVAVLVLGVAGYKFWQYYESQQRQKAATAYAVAMQLGEAGKDAAAAPAFAKIAKDAPGGYAVVAHLAEADSLLEAGKSKEAIGLYESIATKDKSLVGQVARIRAAWAQADSGSKAELQALLAPLLDPKSPWHYMAQEILAYCDYRDGHVKLAQSEYKALMQAADAPSGVRDRAGAMATLLRTSGGGDYGKVPPPAAPATPQPGAATP